MLRISASPSFVHSASSRPPGQLYNHSTYLILSIHSRSQTADAACPSHIHRYFTCGSLRQVFNANNIKLVDGKWEASFAAYSKLKAKSAQKAIVWKTLNLLFFIAEARS